MNCVVEMVTTDIHPFSIDRQYTKKKKHINYRNLAAQSHCKNNNNFNLVMFSADGLL